MPVVTIAEVATPTPLFAEQPAGNKDVGVAIAIVCLVFLLVIPAIAVWCVLARRRQRERQSRDSRKSTLPSTSRKRKVLTT